MAFDLVMDASLSASAALVVVRAAVYVPSHPSIIYLNRLTHDIFRHSMKDEGTECRVLCGRAGGVVEGACVREQVSATPLACQEHAASLSPHLRTRSDSSGRGKEQRSKPAAIRKTRFPTPAVAAQRAENAIFRSSS
ncbi:hypothetical protein BDY17DRAFT_150287 [Neohortaea acidophila]|uniref:Uncharacterized protein n=1 Tax=Neohortaea acidophila TaxID=245834 RepID=A0A6A6PUX6_9PEZI|nr:uncharacterized protein BDY17DRAFT_150287 [Neohortaea acidophila]KAF2483576.1 hypothetical protein BDY17DRAFT_150287 [Neohortaea acidophila]